MQKYVKPGHNDDKLCDIGGGGVWYGVAAYLYTVVMSGFTKLCMTL